MLIVHATPYYPPALQYGGTPEAVASLARAQAKAGHQVYVLTTNAGLDPSLPTQGINLDWIDTNRLTAIGQDQGIPVFYVRNQLPARISQKKLFSAPFWNHETAERLPENYDILHLHEVHIPGYRTLSFNSHQRGAKVVLSPHGSLQPPIHQGIKKILHKIADPILRRGWFIKIDTFIALCNLELKQFVDCDADPAKIALIPHGLPKKAEKPVQLPFRVIDSKYPTFLVLGRQSPLKGILIAVEAFAECWIEGKQGRLICCGPEEGTFSAIQAICSKYHIPLTQGEVLQKPGVYLCPPTIRESLAHLFAISDCTLCPSPYESFGLVLVESLIHDTPVIATNAYGCLDYLQLDSAFLQIIPPNNPIHFKMKMLPLFHTPHKKSQISLEASSLLSWEETASQTVEIYQRILAK